MYRVNLRTRTQCLCLFEVNSGRVVTIELSAVNVQRLQLLHRCVGSLALTLSANGARFHLNKNCETGQYTIKFTTLNIHSGLFVRNKRFSLLSFCRFVRHQVLAISGPRTQVALVAVVPRTEGSDVIGNIIVCRDEQTSYQGGSHLGIGVILQVSQKSNSDSRESELRHQRQIFKPKTTSYSVVSRIFTGLKSLIMIKGFRAVQIQDLPLCAQKRERENVGRAKVYSTVFLKKPLSMWFSVLKIFQFRR